MAADRGDEGRRLRWGPARAALTLVLIAALAGPQAGCSFLFVQKPPPEESRRGSGRVVDCTSSNAAPVIDGLVMGFQMVRTALALSASDAQYAGAPISREADITFGISLTALFAASMIAGFGWTSDCRDAMAEESYPAGRPARPGAGSNPAWRTYQRRQEDQEEEAAVQSRAAERARAEAAQSAAAAEAASHTATPTAPPATAPAVPQHNDKE
jgi:hypothetical protein